MNSNECPVGSTRLTSFLWEHSGVFQNGVFLFSHPSLWEAIFSENLVIPLEVKIPRTCPLPTGVFESDFSTPRLRNQWWLASFRRGSCLGEVLVNHEALWSPLVSGTGVPSQQITVFVGLRIFFFSYWALLFNHPQLLMCKGGNGIPFAIFYIWFVEVSGVEHMPSWQPDQYSTASAPSASLFIGSLCYWEWRILIP